MRLGSTSNSAHILMIVCPFVGPFPGAHKPLACLDDEIIGHLSSVHLHLQCHVASLLVFLRAVPLQTMLSPKPEIPFVDGLKGGPIEGA